MGYARHSVRIKQTNKQTSSQVLPAVSQKCVKKKLHTKHTFFPELLKSVVAHWRGIQHLRECKPQGSGRHEPRGLAPDIQLIHTFPWTSLLPQEQHMNEFSRSASLSGQFLYSSSVVVEHEGTRAEWYWPETYRLYRSRSVPGRVGNGEDVSRPGPLRSGNKTGNYGHAASLVTACRLPCCWSCGLSGWGSLLLQAPQCLPWWQLLYEYMALAAAEQARVIMESCTGKIERLRRAPAFTAHCTLGSRERSKARRCVWTL
jgi:hypothetical protein